MTLFLHSNIEQHLQRTLAVGRNQYCIYEVLAYVLRPYLQVGFQGDAPSADQQELSRMMSGVCVTVEWAFKEIKK